MSVPTENDRMVALRGQASIEDDEPTRPDGGAAPGVTPLRSVGRPLGRWIDSLGRRGLRLGVSFKTGTTILSLGGRLDQHSAPLLKEGFHEIVALTPRAIDIDLSSVNRIDGIGLAALVWSWGLAHQRGRQLRLLHVPSATREIVSRMNLHHVLQVVEDGSFR